METIFLAGNTLVLPAWLLLMFGSSLRITDWLVHKGIIPALLALAYMVLIGYGMDGSTGDFTSLEGVKALFSSDAMVVAGWFHYLVFDMLIGSYVARTASAKGYSRLWVVPVLLLTFMLGPLGWLTFRSIDLINSLSRER